MLKITNTQIAEAIYEIYKSNDNVSVMADSIAAFLTANHRTKDLNIIMRAYERLRFERDGQVDIVSKSAFDLPLTIESQIELRLKSEFNNNKVKFIWVKKQEPSVLGGVSIISYGRQLDITLKHKLDLLKKSLVA